MENGNIKNWKECLINKLNNLNAMQKGFKMSEQRSISMKAAIAYIKNIIGQYESPNEIICQCLKRGSSCEDFSMVLTLLCEAYEENDLREHFFDSLKSHTLKIDDFFTVSDVKDTKSLYTLSQIVDVMISKPEDYAQLKTINIAITNQQMVCSNLEVINIINTDPSAHSKIKIIDTIIDYFGHSEISDDLACKLLLYLSKLEHKNEEGEKHLSYASDKKSSKIDTDNKTSASGRRTTAQKHSGPILSLYSLTTLAIETLKESRKIADEVKIQVLQIFCAKNSYDLVFHMKALIHQLPHNNSSPQLGRVCVSLNQHEYCKQANAADKVKNKDLPSVFYYSLNSFEFAMKVGTFKEEDYYTVLRIISGDEILQSNLINLANPEGLLNVMNTLCISTILKNSIASVEKKPEIYGSYSCVQTPYEVNYNSGIKRALEDIRNHSNARKQESRQWCYTDDAKHIKKANAAKQKVPKHSQCKDSADIVSNSVEQCSPSSYFDTQCEEGTILPCTKYEGLAVFGTRYQVPCDVYKFDVPIHSSGATHSFGDVYYLKWIKCVKLALEEMKREVDNGEKKLVSVISQNQYKLDYSTASDQIASLIKKLDDNSGLPLIDVIISYLNASYCESLNTGHIKKAFNSNTYTILLEFFDRVNNISIGHDSDNMCHNSSGGFSYVFKISKFKLNNIEAFTVENIKSLNPSNTGATNGSEVQHKMQEMDQLFEIIEMMIDCCKDSEISDECAYEVLDTLSQICSESTLSIKKSFSLINLAVQTLCKSNKISKEYTIRVLFDLYASYNKDAEYCINKQILRHYQMNNHNLTHDEVLQIVEYDAINLHKCLTEKYLATMQYKAVSSKDDIAEQQKFNALFGLYSRGKHMLMMKAGIYESEDCKQLIGLVGKYGTIIESGKFSEQCTIKNAMDLIPILYNMNMLQRCINNVTGMREESGHGQHLVRNENSSQIENQASGCSGIKNWKELFKSQAQIIKNDATEKPKSDLSRELMAREMLKAMIAGSHMCTNVKVSATLEKMAKGMIARAPEYTNVKLSDEFVGEFSAAEYIIQKVDYFDSPTKFIEKYLINNDDVYHSVVLKKILYKLYTENSHDVDRHFFELFHEYEFILDKFITTTDIEGLYTLRISETLVIAEIMVEYSKFDVSDELAFNLLSKFCQHNNASAIVNTDLIDCFLLFSLLTEKLLSSKSIMYEKKVEVLSCLTKLCKRILITHIEEFTKCFHNAFSHKLIQADVIFDSLTKHQYCRKQSVTKLSEDIVEQKEFIDIIGLDTYLNFKREMSGNHYRAIDCTFVYNTLKKLCQGYFDANDGNVARVLSNEHNEYMSAIIKSFIIRVISKLYIHSMLNSSIEKIMAEKLREVLSPPAETLQHTTTEEESSVESAPNSDLFIAPIRINQTKIKSSPLQEKILPSITEEPQNPAILSSTYDVATSATKDVLKNNLDTNLQMHFLPFLDNLKKYNQGVHFTDSNSDKNAPVYDSEKEKFEQQKCASNKLLDELQNQVEQCTSDSAIRTLILKIFNIDTKQCFESIKLKLIEFITKSDKEEHNIFHNTLKNLCIAIYDATPTKAQIGIETVQSCTPQMIEYIINAGTKLYTNEKSICAILSDAKGCFGQQARKCYSLMYYVMGEIERNSYSVLGLLHDVFASYESDIIQTIADCQKQSPSMQRVKDTFHKLRERNYEINYNKPTSFQKMFKCSHEKEKTATELHSNLSDTKKEELQKTSQQHNNSDNLYLKRAIKQDKYCNAYERFFMTDIKGILKCNVDVEEKTLMDILYMHQIYSCISALIKSFNGPSSATSSDACVMQLFNEPQQTLY